MKRLLPFIIGVMFVVDITEFTSRHLMYLLLAPLCQQIYTRFVAQRLNSLDAAVDDVREEVQELVADVGGLRGTVTRNADVLNELRQFVEEAASNMQERMSRMEQAF